MSVRALYPEVRVTYLLREHGEWKVFTEFQAFSQVSVSLSTRGSGRAQIVYPNINDKYFDPGYYGKVADVEQTKWLGDVLRGSCGVLEGESGKMGPSEVLPNADFVSRDFINPDWYNGWTNTHMFHPLGLVWIDAVGPYENDPSGGWYGIFTGVITRIRDSWTAGQLPTLTIECETLGRWLKLTSIASRISLFAQILLNEDARIKRLDPSIKQTLEEFAEEKEPFETIQAVAFDQFVPMVLDATYKSMFPRKGLASVKYRPIPFLPWAPSKYGTSTKANPYVGFSNFRESVGGAFPESERLGLYLLRNISLEQVREPVSTSEVPLSSTSDLNSSYLSEVAKVTDYTEIPYALGQWAVDRLFIEDQPLTEANGNTFFTAFRKALYDSMQLWTPKFELPLDMLERGFHAILADVYFDGVGNLIMTFPKYDGLPGEEGPSYSTGSYGPPSPEEEEHFDTLRYHGRDYILDGTSGMVSWEFADNENQVVTGVLVPTNPAYVDGSEQFGWATTGISFCDRDTMRDFGLRVLQTDQMFPSTLITADTQIVKGEVHGDLRLLDSYAEGVRKRLSGRRFNGSVSLQMRPDIQLGRTVFHVERGMSYYVSGVSHRYTRGKDFITNLSLEYGRRPHERIGAPWFKLRGIKVSQPVSPSTGWPAQTYEALGGGQFAPWWRSGASTLAFASARMDARAEVDTAIAWRPLVLNGDPKAQKIPFLKVTCTNYFPSLQALKDEEEYGRKGNEILGEGWGAGYTPPYDKFYKIPPTNSAKGKQRIVNKALSNAILGALNGGVPGLDNITVSSISGGDHDPDSRHYSHRALDIKELNGTSVQAASNYTHGKGGRSEDVVLVESFIAYVMGYLSIICRVTRGAERENLGAAVLWNLGPEPTDKNHQDHIHISVPASVKETPPDYTYEKDVAGHAT